MPKKVWSLGWNKSQGKAGEDSGTVLDSEIVARNMFFVLLAIVVMVLFLFGVVFPPSTTTATPTKKTAVTCDYSGIIETGDIIKRNVPVSIYLKDAGDNVSGIVTIGGETTSFDLNPSTGLLTTSKDFPEHVGVAVNVAGLNIGQLESGGGFTPHPAFNCFQH